MFEELRPLARIIHLLFSLLAALVVYLLIWFTFSEVVIRSSKRSYYGLVLFCLAWASLAALLMHAYLDWVIGVP
jgi:maltodextrin utilization protein YvdJ